MFEDNPDLLKFGSILSSPGKKIAMLAPSFIVDFDYPKIIGDLKGIGFDLVTEITTGAAIVNNLYKEYLAENPDQPLISSACPSVVSLLKSRYPDLRHYLAPFVSPMGAMSRLLHKLYPDYTLVFIGPCFAKKAEAKLYHPEIAVVLTYKELHDYLSQRPTGPMVGVNAEFDSFFNDETKIYPLPGGMTDTACLKMALGDDKIVIDEGVANTMNIFQNFTDITKTKQFFDLLNCTGGCLGGPGIETSVPFEQRKQNLIAFMQTTKKKHADKKKVTQSFPSDIDYTRSF